MKILIVRFSSIGDIVLTTPIIRAIKTQRPDVKIHYLTRKSYTPLLEHNPHIEKLVSFNERINEIIPELKKEQYDLIVDLHKNIRTLRLKFALKRPTSSFDKENFKKWILVNFKKDTLPKVHVVDRYFSAVKPLNVFSDQKPGELFIAPEETVDTLVQFELKPKKYVTIAIGAQFGTKRMPEHLVAQIIEKCSRPMLIVGGPEDRERGTRIVELCPEKNIINTCGEFTIMQSASVVSQSATLLTGDTGMMHIAACFDVPIVSVWGNTVPALGMYPYCPHQTENYSIHEVTGLKCRPCSKIGFQDCPKKHFNCMNLHDVDAIVHDLEARSSKTT